MMFYVALGWGFFAVAAVAVAVVLTRLLRTSEKQTEEALRLLREQNPRKLRNEILALKKKLALEICRRKELERELA